MRHQFLLLLGAIVLVALAQLLHLRLKHLHLGHQLVALVGQREEHELHEHRGGEDGEAVVAEEQAEPMQQLEQGFGDEMKPAPIDQQVEPVGAEFFSVGLDEIDDFGASKQVG